MITPKSSTFPFVRSSEVQKDKRPKDQAIRIAKNDIEEIACFNAVTSLPITICYP